MNKFDQIEKNLAWHKKSKPKELVVSYDMGAVRDDDLETELRRFLQKLGWYYKNWNVDNEKGLKKKYLFFADRIDTKPLILKLKKGEKLEI